MEINKKQHWENVFATKKETEVSWYQEKPETSLQFFERNNIPKTAKILEIGGGDSYLIDNLLEQRFESITLLDISENAIERIKKRLGEKAEKVRFVVSDILDFSPSEKFDVIHDRNSSFQFFIKSLPMGAAINPVIDSKMSFVIWMIAPFNILKSGLISLLTLPMYKKTEKVLNRVK